MENFLWATASVLVAIAVSYGLMEQRLIQQQVNDEMRDQIDKTITRNALDSARYALKEIHKLARKQREESASPHHGVFDEIENMAKVALENLPERWPPK